MDADTVTAVCATGIAALSLAVSVTEGRAVRRHNRLSVAPALAMRATRQRGSLSGITLHNTGLGPAVITASSLALDGTGLGGWKESEVNVVRDLFPYWVSATVFNEERSVIPPGFEGFLLRVAEYDGNVHGDFWHLVRHRLSIELEYESMYGEKGLRAVFSPYDGATGISTLP